MKISLIQAHELDAGLIETWRSIQAGNPGLRSPYYTPEYAQAVHASLRQTEPARDDFAHAVEIAVIESSDTGRVEAFFPFQRGAWGQVFPVGRFMTDYHGMVCADDFSACTAGELLAGIRARYFAFNHMPLTAAVFAPAVRIHHASPVLNTEGGHEAYLQRLREFHGSPSAGGFATLRKGVNRITRDLGPLRFEMQTGDSEVLETLIKLKIAQWKIGNPNSYTAFERPWVNHLVRALAEQANGASGAQVAAEGGFRSVLSALYAGDTLVASQLSLRHAQTLHGWFSAYEPERAYYSVGMILLTRLTEQFANGGGGLIDLGRGAVPYKMRIATGSIPMGEGAVSQPAVLARAYMGSRLAWRDAQTRHPFLGNFRERMRKLKQSLK